MSDDYEVRCPHCNTLVATETGDKAAQARADAITFPCEPCARRNYGEDVLKLRDTWYRTDGVAVEDSLCIWCLRKASLCVIVNPCGDRESYEDERWVAVHGVETR